MAWVMHKIFIHIVNFMDPENCTKCANSVHQNNLGCYKLMNRKCECLHQGFEMLTNQVVTILNNVCSTQRGAQSNHWYQLIAVVLQMLRDQHQSKLYWLYARYISQFWEELCGGSQPVYPVLDPILESNINVYSSLWSLIWYTFNWK